MGRELSFRNLEDWFKTKSPPLGGAVTAATPFRKGWMIYQLRDADGEDEPQNRAVLRYGSKAWNRSMRSRPPYYKEADGLITAATDARYYAEATAFPLLLFTDHAPLQYIKTCAKGPVTGPLAQVLMYWSGAWSVYTRSGNSVASA